VSIHLERITVRAEKFPTEKHYPFTLPVFRQMPPLPVDASVMCFVGENGSGKSTLLEAVARACGIHIWQAEGGTRYQGNPVENLLYRYVQVKWADGPVAGSFFGSDIFRDFAKLVDAWAAADPGQLKYYGGKSLLTQSHGESLMSYFRNRCRIKGLYLLDEPETALSPKSQLELLTILSANGESGNAQFILATHSPILLACPKARIYSFDTVPVRSIAYEETDHYRIYKEFLEDRNKYL